MVEKLKFGAGSTLFRITDGLCSADILPYGATLRALRVPGRDGKPVDVVLGYDSEEEYRANDAFLGALVGRYANRIGGAKFTLNGVEYTTCPNEGPNTLHGGREGFDKKTWAVTPRGEHSVVCVLDSPDGEEGFPGHLHVEVTYTLKDGALTIEYEAVSDRDTVVNLTNHAYFNLAGEGTVEDHVITLRASRFTPVDAALIPTGELGDVTGTALDLRRPTVLGERFPLPELAATNGFDHNFVLDAPQFAAVTCPRTGITMTVSTDLEGSQLYTSGALTPRKGKGGAVYGVHSGLCLETQHFPDAVNKPAFPSPILRAGEKFHSVTTYAFTAQ